MKPANLISAYKGARIYADESKDSKYRSFAKPYSLKDVEIDTISMLCNEMLALNVPFSVFDGYFIGYCIEQIGKEFDLLRFSDDMAVNIELKSGRILEEFNDKELTEKILKQQTRNYYYLNALKKDIYICTYVENEGLFEYDAEKKKTRPVNLSELVRILEKQEFNDEIDPDILFKPSKYLISPFLKTKQFIKGKYFLTEHQERIKKDILKSLNGEYSISCLTADAGTGKTLLLYDIAKEYNKKSLLIHCGKLNDGHKALISDYGWNIHPIKDIKEEKVSESINSDIKLLLVDESQRIRQDQLELIIEKSSQLKIPVIFSYDPKQYLSNKDESKDIYDYLTQNYDMQKYGCEPKKYKLTKKIRTNPKISSFISNMLQIGSDGVKFSYDDISIEYFDRSEELIAYSKYLAESKNWKLITYTSIKTDEQLFEISRLSETNAHDVIGQEFDKVAFIMDNNFMYNDEGKLKYNTAVYYDLSGMLYQIITRAVNGLKIIVYNNKDLYYKLQYIRSKGENK